MKVNSRLKPALTGSSALAAMMLPSALSAQAQEAQQPQAKPNIIYILADDAGYGDAGCYGQKDFKTPGIDRLAEEGIRFTDHYSGAPVCAPSRSSLLTGYHTGNTVVRGNKELLPEGQHPMPDETLTIAEILKEEGYVTGATGKWGLGYPGSEGAPENQGFDYFYGYNCQRQAHSYYPSHLWETGKKIKLKGRPWSHDLIAEKAFNFIKENKDQPFFLYVPFAIPHALLQVPDTEPYKKKPWNSRKKKFAAMMHRMDRDINKIIDLVDELGLGENTLIIYASDNGPHKEGGADPKFFNSSGIYRGKKRDLYEGGIRVPMVARWTGTIEPGRVTDHISAFWDILPTFADMAGAETPAGIDGISMLPLLTGNGEQQQHEWLYWEFHEQGGKQAVRMGKWKGVRLNVFRDRDGAIELYDLEKDPSEKEDIAGKNPEIVAEMARIMKEGRTPSAVFNGFEQ